MKNIYLLLSAALVLGACQSDALDEASVQPNTPTTTITPTPQVSFAQPDGAVKLSDNTAQAVWQLLQKVSPEQALQLGETEITDAQYAEIKEFVDANLKDEYQYKTYLNIFQWIVKNVKYAWTGEAYLNPYDVFKYKTCICQGYANLLKTMCLTQGIPCFVANGWLSTIGGHAWNYVYADGDWYVSDPTNNQEFKAANVGGYEKTLIPQRIDFNLFEDDKCVYNYQEGQLNVTKVKDTNSNSLVLPYSIAGFQITSFQLNEKMPDSVTHLFVGANLVTFGYTPESMSRFCPNLEAIEIDPQNKDLESFSDVAYLTTNKSYPYFVPAGIKRIELRPMEVVDKNTLSFLDKLEEIVIAEGTKRIEQYAVEKCPNLKTIYVPNSVTYIDKNAFADCGNNYQIINTTTGIHEVRK